MIDIPHAVLSERFQEHMKGRHLREAVFLTYRFDPGFFEQEILPIFFDVPLSHVPVIRLLQLEDALRGLPGEIAVYYDADGLETGDGDSSRLDLRRIPVRLRSGAFHPKNLLLLVEEDMADDHGRHPRTLLVASHSANLTRSGWWENVEACQIETIAEGGPSSLKEDLLHLLERLRLRSPSGVGPRALLEVQAFLKAIPARRQRSAGGNLHPHIYTGRESLVDFLARVAGRRLHGTHLEVISPYFDDAARCLPLEALIERFCPKSVRVFLPRSAAGEGLCRPELYEAVKELPAVRWGRLPREILRLGRSDDAGERFVHAKVYRFFTQQPRSEICFVGSANLTTAAHQKGGNLESGFLVDCLPTRRPEFWLSVDDQRPLQFKLPAESAVAAQSSGTPLNLRYHWDTGVAEVYWDSPGVSPELRLEAKEQVVGQIKSLVSRTWTQLSKRATARVAKFLSETSFFFVHGHGPSPAMLLVQEDGMSHKPSMLLRLTAADILRYWSLLSAEQRTAFLDARAPDLAQFGAGAELVARYGRPHPVDNTLFDRFAGIFHAFGCLERAARQALAEGHERDVDYRLFGKKYDSLGSLLDRIEQDKGSGDAVNNYVILLCARQLCQEIKKDHPDYWLRNIVKGQALESGFQKLAVIRQMVVDAGPEDLRGFLTWFDTWFLLRAQPAGEIR